MCITSETSYRVETPCTQKLEIQILTGLYTEGYEYFAKARTKKDAKVYVAFKVLDDLDCAEYCGGYEGEGNFILTF